MRYFFEKYNLEYNKEILENGPILSTLYEEMSDLYPSENILFFKIKMILYIHCFDYYRGFTLKDKNNADKRLRRNLYKYVNKKSKFWLTKVIRRYSIVNFCHLLSISNASWEKFKKISSLY